MNENRKKDGADIRNKKHEMSADEICEGRMNTESSKEMNPSNENHNI